MNRSQLKMVSEIETFLERMGPSTSVEIYEYLRKALPHKHAMTINELSKFIKMKCKNVTVNGKKKGYNVYGLKVKEKKEPEKYILDKEDAIWVLDERI